MIFCYLHLLLSLRFLNFAYLLHEVQLIDYSNTLKMFDVNVCKKILFSKAFKVRH